MSNVGSPSGRSVLAMTTASGSAAWKAHVYSYHGPGLGNGVRVLLLLLADYMDQRRHVTVPRSRLAAQLGITEDQVKRRVAAAKKAGLLDNVVKGHNGVTAVYRGLFASGPTGSSGTRKGAPSSGGREQTPTPRRGTVPVSLQVTRNRTPTSRVGVAKMVPPLVRATTARSPAASQLPHGKNQER